MTTDGGGRLMEGIRVVESGLFALVPAAAGARRAHIDEVLLELGYHWDDIVRFKTSGAVL